LKNITVGLLCVCLFVGWLASTEASNMPENVSQSGAFSPSNARTEDGKLIPVEQFFPSSRCASCHADTHKSWSQSLHRNAAREPFYRESADILLRTRGIELTRHCESCHTPVALFSGALSKESAQQQAPFTKMDDEGVTCSVCHSITEARLDGTGSFTIRRPALLAREDGTPIYGNFTDEQILADVPAHKRAVMRPLLKQPEFCSTCHKVDAPAELNKYKHIRGFSAYDEWQQSGASHESVLPFYRRENRTDCRACHMPKIESLNDRAAKGGMIASHKWLGANTAAPLFYGQTEQVELTRQFLEKDVIDVDIFAVKSTASGTGASALENNQSITMSPGEEITAEVVVSNRNAAHSFPPEVRDLYEAWLEFEAIDDTGKTVFHSGFLKADGMLDQSAHVYKAILLDESGRHITRHQIWTTNIKAYDNTIQAGRSDVARFRFQLPDGGLPMAKGNGKKMLGSVSLTLRARLNYRRVNQEYSNYIQSQRNTTLTLPIIKMAAAETQLWIGNQQGKTQQTANRNSQSTIRSPQWKRWNDYGIGLLEQAQYGAASLAFRRASELAPDNVSLLVNAAIAEMRTERFGPEREQLKKAAVLLEEALKIAPDNMRARYFQALVFRGQGKFSEAAEALAEIARQYPRDREVQRQFGQTLYSLGRLPEARTALEAILSIDPTDALAYQLLSPLYESEGRKAESRRALALYYEWRDDPRADAIGARFFAAHPEWAEERVTSHTHGKASASRPVLTGSAATPDR
jgi:tetratricopeptide (TPR) repeat protein